MDCVCDERNLARVALLGRRRVDIFQLLVSIFPFRFNRRINLTRTRYWGVWFPRDSFTSGFVWMFLMLFELFYVGLGQFIAAFSPNPLFASLLVPTFFTFVLSFCGVVVPYSSLNVFWRSWMYWLTPFHYLLEGFLSVVVHGVPVRCVPREESEFSPPSGMTCQEYAGSYASQIGGYVQDAGNGLCAFCQYSVGDAFVCLPCLILLFICSPQTLIMPCSQARNFNVYYSHKWRNYVC